MDLRTVWSTYQIPDQSMIHRETSSQTSSTKKKKQNSPTKPNRTRITRQQQYHSKLLWLIWQLRKSNKHLESTKTQATCCAIEGFFKPDYWKQEDPPTIWAILSGERSDKRTWEQGVVTHTFNPRAPEAQAGVFLWRQNLLLQDSYIGWRPLVLQESSWLLAPDSGC